MTETRIKYLTCGLAGYDCVSTHVKHQSNSLNCLQTKEIQLRTACGDKDDNESQQERKRE